MVQVDVHEKRLDKHDERITDVERNFYEQTRDIAVMTHAVQEVRDDVKAMRSFPWKLIAAGGGVAAAVSAIIAILAQL